MSEVTRLFHALSKGEKQLANVKFFRGDNNNVTQEEFCREAADALAQVSSGLSVRIESIDGPVKRTTVQEFLA